MLWKDDTLKLFMLMYKINWSQLGIFCDRIPFDERTPL
jgi:hypothetical protein